LRKPISWFNWFLVVIFGSVLVLTVILMITEIVNSVKSVPVTAVKSQPNIYQLSQWAYSNSSRISRDTVNVIVKEAMTTDKPLLILAIIPVESEFVPSAVSKKGAIGLMQVMFDVHKDMLIKRGIIKDKRDLFDIEPNIQAGNAILDMYLGECKGDVASALEKYLGGQDGVYLKKILSNLANLYILEEN